MKHDDDYLFDKSGEPDPDVVKLESALSPLRYKKPAVARVAKPRRTWAPKVVTLLALAAMVLVYFWFRSTRPPEEGLAVTRLEGTPRIATHDVGDRGNLGVGAWLETDGTSRADIELARIGHIEVLPGSRVKLASFGPNEQRLELAKGAIEARVVAPPRLFVVDTPSARATDLGCAYRLEVTDPGGSLLHVKLGAVELAGEGKEAWVPATAACETRPKRGPGCPWFENASAPFIAALRRVDFEDGGPDDLSTVLAEARPRDTLTLWHLGARSGGETRTRIFARIRDLTQGTWSNEPSLNDLSAKW
jgi:hypothetical protein